MIKKVTGMYFSPAGGAALMTERLAREIATLLNDYSSEDVTVECCDLTKDHVGGIGIDDETVVVIGMPVYIGKIPLPAARILRSIAGNSALAFAAVSYGGRSYGNALYELKSLLEDCDFRPIGAGAFLVNYMAARGSSRSSAPVVDTDSLMEFGKAAAAKIQRLSGSEIEELRIKPMPVEIDGRMPVHIISRISPKAAARAQKVLEVISLRKRQSEWFL